jgi:nanoRNase/pAp phosphatase (c-di-AMP/oligoRNAs hydrolase)
MKGPFGKSVSAAEKVQKLHKVITSGDSLAILVNADPDSLASALALQRLFWRKVRQTHIYRVNWIDRADNLAFVKLLDIRQRHIRSLKKSEITKWALVDSQPAHNERFAAIDFDIVIDHHPLTDHLEAKFIDIQENYGATATLMTEYLKADKIKPSTRLATALFYAIKTDTDNFVRPTVSRDIIAFRYLYDFANMNIIKKIESSEITRNMLPRFQEAMQELEFVKQMAVVHLGVVKKPDILVQVADFLLKMAEATWSITSGIYNQQLIIVLRNAGFTKDAGEMAHAFFGQKGSAGGHKDTARAEVPLEHGGHGAGKEGDCRHFVLKHVRKMSRTLNA